jgi:uncharacterized protein YrrD
MPNLGVSHLAFGETDGETAGLELSEGHLLSDAVQSRRSLLEDGIVCPLRADAPAVEDGENDPVRRLHRLPTLTTASPGLPTSALA